MTSTPDGEIASSLTRTQRETLEHELGKGKVLAYGRVGYRLEVLTEVASPAGMTVHDLPWRVVQCFDHGWIEHRLVGLSQASLVLADVTAAGGVQLQELPVTPDGWYGWR